MGFCKITSSGFKYKITVITGIGNWKCLSNLWSIINVARAFIYFTFEPSFHAWHFKDNVPFFFFFEITNMYCDFMNTEGLLIPIYEKLNSNCSSHNVKNCTPPLGMRTVTLMMIQPRAYILALGRDKNKIGMLIGPKGKHMRPKIWPKLLASAKSCCLMAVKLFYDESEYQLPSHRDWLDSSIVLSTFYWG